MLSIIKSLDSSKSHGYDNISIKMIQICSESFTMPLKIIFEESLKKRIFQIYINDLPDEIISMCKIFADDTSLFSKLPDINKSVTGLNTDLEKISQWVY